jgi:bacillithiol biosynthesis cysteine-adding enzyme BshC
MPTASLDLTQLPSASLLLRDYAGRFDRLAPFFARNPHDPAAVREAATACDRQVYPRAALRAILADRNRRWGAPEAVLKNIATLEDPAACVVFSGQQTGLFGGPLFTLYKALTALKLADRLQADLGRPVVPLFWMASEDHDVAEVDHALFADRGGELVRVRHDSWAEPQGFMAANLRLGPGIADTLARARACLPETEFLPALSAALGEAYAPEATLGDAFARWMTHLLGRLGLVLVDGADPRLKPLAARIVQQELAEAPRSSRTILEASQALGEAGYPTQIEARPDGVNCFLLREGRHPLVRDGGSFRLRDTGKAIPVPELKRLAQEQPEQFSPNVALRPIVQDALFPTLAYVAGPGELAYFAQLAELYAAFRVPMPLILPRASFTLLEPRVAQLLDRFRLELPDFSQEPEQLASRLFRAQLPPDLEAIMRKAREGVDAIFEEVGAAIAAVDPTLRATVGQTAGHLKGHLEQLEKKAVQAVKRREAETRQQLHRVRQALMPGGKPQERVFTTLPFLAKYGPALVDVVRRNLDGPGWSHTLLPLTADGRPRPGG